MTLQLSVNIGKYCINLAKDTPNGEKKYEQKNAPETA